MNSKNLGARIMWNRF
jgi:hypothetical protein